MNEPTDPFAGVRAAIASSPARSQSTSSGSRFSLSASQIGRICVYVLAGCSFVSSDWLHGFGLSTGQVVSTLTFVGHVSLVTGLIYSVIMTVSRADAGTTYALIPKGSSPVVVAAPGVDSPSVAVADPSLVLKTTSASIAPPKQAAP